MSKKKPSTIELMGFYSLHFKKILATFLLCFFCNQAVADETLVFIRHAEKPTLGLGQLSCQGLNRSLKIPHVLFTKFGHPDFIYAPNPGDLKNDKGHDYYYIRPLATIEPTAISLNMPVILKYGFKDHQAMTEELLDKSKVNSTIFVAWEHHLAAQIVENILTVVNGQSNPITWDDSDFDTILVVKIKDHKAQLIQDSEGLNDQTNTCE